MLTSDGWGRNWPFGNIGGEYSLTTERVGDNDVHGSYGIDNHGVGLRAINPLIRVGGVSNYS